MRLGSRTVAKWQRRVAGKGGLSLSGRQTRRGLATEGVAALFKNCLKKVLRALVITIFYWHITTPGMGIAAV